MQTRMPLSNESSRKRTTLTSLSLFNHYCPTPPSLPFSKTEHRIAADELFAPDGQIWKTLVQTACHLSA